MPRRLSHIVGFDDAPFERTHRGDVLVVGTVFSGSRLDGVLSCKVRRDGHNATRAIAECVLRSRFYRTDSVALQFEELMLKGISVPTYEVSAMTMRNVMRYWIRSPEPMHRILKGNLQELFIAPMQRKLESLGCQIHLHHTLTHLEPDQGRIARLERTVRDRARRASRAGVGEGAGRPLDTAALTAALGDRTLVEYVSVEGTLHAVTVAGGRARLHIVASAAQVEDEVRFMVFALRRVLAPAGRARDPMADVDAEYTDLDTSTATSGEARTVAGVRARFLRVKKVSSSGGASLTAKILP